MVLVIYYKLFMWYFLCLWNLILRVFCDILMCFRFRGLEVIICNNFFLYDFKMVVLRKVNLIEGDWFLDL